MLLGEHTWEREAGAGLSPLESIRLIQATAALTQAVLLSPDSASAHATLAQVCVRQNAMDLAQRHAEAAARLIRRSEAATGESAARADALSEALLESVQEAQNRFLVRTEALAGDPLARAAPPRSSDSNNMRSTCCSRRTRTCMGQAALACSPNSCSRRGRFRSAGLCWTAPNCGADANALGNYALARKPNPDGSRPPYQLPAYDWLDLCQCAAAGRYAGIEEAIGRLCERLAAREQTEMAVVADAAGACWRWKSGWPRRPRRCSVACSTRASGSQLAPPWRKRKRWRLRGPTC